MEQIGGAYIRGERKPISEEQFDKLVRKVNRALRKQLRDKNKEKRDKKQVTCPSPRASGVTATISSPTCVIEFKETSSTKTDDSCVSH